MWWNIIGTTVLFTGCMLAGLWLFAGMAFITIVLLFYVDDYEDGNAYNEDDYYEDDYYADD